MNSYFVFAILILAVSCWNDRYGWPDEFERYLENQGVYDYQRHAIREEYSTTRVTYESDLSNLYNDWQQQTGYGQPGYNPNNFGGPMGGYGQYGFPGYGK